MKRFIGTCVIITVFAYFGGPLLLGVEDYLSISPSHFLSIERFVIFLLPFLILVGVLSTLAGSFRNGGLIGAALLMVYWLPWNPNTHTLVNFYKLLAVGAIYGAVFGGVAGWWAGFAKKSKRDPPR